MKRLICIQSSSDYCYINICDFKATHKQVIFQDLRFYHSVVTSIWEELAPSNSSNCLPSNTAFHLTDTNLTAIFSHLLPYIMQ